MEINKIDTLFQYLKISFLFFTWNQACTYEFRKGSSVTIATKNICAVTEKMRFHLAPVGSGSNVLELGISV